MNNRIADVSMHKLAKLAGIGYLIIFITGIYANFFVLENLVVTGDAAKTVNNIMTNDFLFRLGILSFLFMVLFDVLLAWALYILFIPVNKNLSLLSGWLRLINGTIFGIALFNLFSILHILTGPEYTELFRDDLLFGQVMLFLYNFNSTWLIGLIFFGGHLFLLGYLIYKSGYVPRIIGILLIIAAAGYITDSIASFLLASYADYKDIFSLIVIIPGIVGELSFTFWLIFKSTKIPEATS